MKRNLGGAKRGELHRAHDELRMLKQGVRVAVVCAAGGRVQRLPVHGSKHQQRQTAGPEKVQQPPLKAREQTKLHGHLLVGRYVLSVHRDQMAVLEKACLHVVVLGKEREQRAVLGARHVVPCTVREGAKGHEPAVACTRAGPDGVYTRGARQAVLETAARRSRARQVLLRACFCRGSRVEHQRVPPVLHGSAPRAREHRVRVWRHRVRNARAVVRQLERGLLRHVRREARHARRRHASARGVCARPTLHHLTFFVCTRGALAGSKRFSDITFL